ncbi:hypothetical protein FSP39_019224 [Pinctada imbricata]|uniref:ATP-dependent DNA helicase n=1 Tax=Pinctada imbricata TaxID=66713 RepID=A0AA88YU51_PINIB|nr:hypothetical protein FSP39_019224 [Pinctada imbricata]
MLSSKVLKQIEYVCRGVRKKEKYFGGMQVVLSGDFYQLQPVKTELYGDFGQPCFQVAWFDDVFPHRIKLNVIYRQSEVKLIKAVHELETGHLSEETNILKMQDTVPLMKSLSRDLPPGQLVNAVHLFSRNVDVLLFNKNKLEQLHGQLHTFVSEDEGSKHYIDKFLAPQHLGLKIGCPVMLLVNLSDTLVNGKIGSVKHIEKNKIHVEFMISGKERVVNIERFIFTKYDPVSNTMIAKRRLFPLTLPYSFTIHKAQGMSIKNRVIDCKNSFPGQIGFAVGRAISLDGLCVKNFIPSLCCPHPQEISRFYNKFKEGCSDELESLSCCRATKLIQGKDNEWEIRKTESENNNDSKRSEVSKVTCK